MKTYTSQFRKKSGKPKKSNKLAELGISPDTPKPKQIPQKKEECFKMVEHSK